jgi:hypothetical protein
MRYFLASLIGLIVVIGLILVWFLTRPSDQGAVTNESGQVTTLTGLLSLANGLFGITESVAGDSVIVGNSHEPVVVEAFRGLVGQVVTISGTIAANDPDTILVESVNQQPLVLSTMAPLPAPGLGQVFANLPASQQQCLVAKLDSQVFTKLVTEPVYQLTPADSLTLETCLNRNGGGS